MKDDKVLKIIKQIDNFPSLPDTVAKVITVTTNPDSSARDLMHAILPDQSMCASILRIANSAFFGYPRQVSTIERAVVVLGFDEVRNIALGRAVFNSFNSLQQHARDKLDLFWDHAFTCGLAAKIIGEHLNYSASELFIAGLIHDIGKLAMLMAFPQEYALLGGYDEQAQLRNVELEHDRYAISHDQVGMKILRKWNFPDQLVAAVAHHHSPDQALDNKIYPILVQTADLLALMYSRPDKLDASDVEIIFTDFLPECKRLWLENNLHWDDEKLGLWFDELKETHEENSSFLELLAA